jgi:hypothetical protein
MQDWEKELFEGFSPEEMAEVEAYMSGPRECCGLPRNGDLEKRPCREGNCVELFCPCGAPDGSGWGPVGCPCQDD